MMPASPELTMRAPSKAATIDRHEPWGTVMRLLAALSAAALVLAPGAASAATFGAISRASAGAQNCFPLDTATDNQSGPIFSSASASAAGATAQASASLATGNLRLFGSSSGGSCSVAGSQVAFFDQLTFDLPDGVEGADVTFALTIEGFLGGDPNSDQGNATINIDGVSTFLFPGGLEGLIGQTLSYTRVVHDGEQVDLNASINANLVGGGPAFFDLSHTATFSLGFAPGTTFASASGVFLTDSGGVPEPASWALLILGFGGAGAAIRRRRASRRVVA
jgi:hypothetical protein